MACAPRWHDTVRFDIRHRWGGGVVLVVTANHSSCSALFLPLMADGLRCDSSLHATSTGALARIYSWGAFWSISVWRRSLAFSDEDERHALLQGTNVFYIVRLMSLRGHHPTHSQAMLGFWKLKNEVEMKQVSWRWAGRSAWKEKWLLYSNPLCTKKLDKLAPSIDSIVCIDIIYYYNLK